MTALLMFVGLLLLVAINVPIAVALAAITVIMMVALQGTDILPNVALVMYSGSTSFPLVAIPLFILAGGIMNTSSISRRLIAFASALLGFIRGSLGMVSVVAAMFFAEISGSAVAGVAALAPILVPAMRSKGYPGAFGTAITSSAASLAVIIPPSIPMILYAVIADTSVVKMFVAGIIPGALCGALMMLTCYIFARVRNYPVGEEFRLSRVWETFKGASLSLMLPLVVLGGNLRWFCDRHRRGRLGCYGSTRSRSRGLP